MSSVSIRGSEPVRLYSIQILRAIAAVMVTIAHASEEAKYFYKFVPPFETDPFGKGVDLFFVISGFIIYYSSLRLFSEPNPAKTFAWNRFVRVIPLYYVFTTAMVGVVLLFPGGVKEATFDIVQIITSYLFIPYARYDGRIAPILSLGWTLNYEIFFYALFAICMFFDPKKAAKRIIILLFILAGIGAFVPDDAFAPLSFWTYNIILEFAMGIGIALAYEKWGKRFARSRRLAVILLVIGFLGIYFLNQPVKPLALPRFLTAGVPASLMVIAAVLLLPAPAEWRLPRWAVALGDSSYSLYLSHRFVQRPVQLVLTKSQIVPPAHLGGIYVTLAVLAAIGVGHVIYLFVEKPLLQRWRSSGRSRASVSSSSV